MRMPRLASLCRRLCSRGPLHVSIEWLGFRPRHKTVQADPDSLKLGSPVLRVRFDGWNLLLGSNGMWRFVKYAGNGRSTGLLGPLSLNDVCETLLGCMHFLEQRPIPQTRVCPLSSGQ